LITEKSGKEKPDLVKFRFNSKFDYEVA
jgi:hypothetical protein